MKTFSLFNVGFRKYFRNTLWLFLEKFFKIGASTIMGIVIARYLGASGYGAYSYALSIVSLLGVFSSLGLADIVVRELVGNENENSDVIGTAISLRLMGSFFIIFVVLILIFLYRNSSEVENLILIFSFINFFSAFFVFESLFHSKVKSQYISYASFFAISISTIFKIVLIIGNYNIYYLAAAMVVENMLLAVFYFIYFSRSKLVVKKLEFKKVLAFDLLKYSWPLVLSGLFISLYMRIDQLMIKEFLSLEDVGLYSVAVKLSEGFFFIPVLISNSLFPAILNAKKSSLKLYRERIQNLYYLMIWIAVLITLPIYFLSEFAVNTLYGDAFSGSAAPLQILILGSAFVFLFDASGKILISENLTKMALYRNLIALFMNILLNLWWIPVYGISGASWATVISYFLSGLFFDLLAPKLRFNFYLKIKALLLVPSIIFGIETLRKRKLI
jgi:O-antigen/teichoic acid export membrane protein